MIFSIFTTTLREVPLSLRLKEGLHSLSHHMSASDILLILKGKSIFQSILGIKALHL